MSGEASPPKRARLKEPLDQVSDVRERVGRQLLGPSDGGDGGAINYDIAQNIREIRAILSTNNEIFDRVMDYKKWGPHHYPEGTEIFTRISFDVVETFQVVLNSKKTVTRFVTYPERSSKTIDTKVLSDLPANLLDIFAPVQKSGRYSAFVDYESYFEKSLILHDDVLEPFLAHLKVHLMSVQICLGEIETWVVEPRRNIDFLETTFGKDVKMPGEDEDLERECACPSGTHPKHIICLHCNCALSAHRLGNCCDGTGFFHCKLFQVLKECHTTSGKIEATFEIMKENEQKKLKKIIEFAEIE